MRRQNQWMAITFVTILAVSLSPVAALNIIITNDDGFETQNIISLYEGLKAAGHDVAISAPFGNQSVTSGYLRLAPIEAVENDSPNGTVKTGSPGLGHRPDDPDIHYVNGTPVTAAYYGMDIVAEKRWGEPPELLISGPNEGHNQGYMHMHSGTLAAANAALLRGIPAIAVSADRSTKKDSALCVEVAAVVVRIVQTLDRSSSAV